MVLLSARVGLSQGDYCAATRRSHSTLAESNVWCTVGVDVDHKNRGQLIRELQLALGKGEPRSGSIRRCAPTRGALSSAPAVEILEHVNLSLARLDSPYEVVRTLQFFG